MKPNLNLKLTLGDKKASHLKTTAEYYADFLFMEAVNKYNSILEATNPNKEDYEVPYIMTREAKAIHNFFSESVFGSNGFFAVNANAMNNMSEEDFKNFCNQGFTAAIKDAFVKANRNNIEGYADIADEAFEKFSNLITNEKIMPLSPYADTNQNKKTFIERGERCLYCELKDLIGYESGNAVMLWDKTEYGLKKENLANSAYDTANISELLQYATVNGKKNYSKEKDILTKFVTDEKTYIITDEMKEKAINILNTITNMGYSYELKTKDRPGVLDASIDDLGISIKLIDVSESRYINGRYDYSYIGTVFDRKTQTSVHNSVIDGYKDDKFITENVPNMELRPLLYYLGQPVKDVNGNKIQIKEEKTTVRSGRGFKDANRIYKDDKSLTVILDESSRGLKYGLHLDCHRETEKAEYDENPDVNLSNMVNSAKKRFVEMINLDALLKEDAECTDPNGSKERRTLPLCLSADDEVAKIQTEIWKFLNQDTALLDPTKRQELEELKKMPASPEKTDRMKACYISSGSNSVKALADSDYLNKVVDAVIGKYDLVENENGKLTRSADSRFDPLKTLRYADSVESKIVTDRRFNTWIGEAGIEKEDFIIDRDLPESSYDQIINHSIRFDSENSITLKDKISDLAANAEKAETPELRQYYLKTAANFYRNIGNKIVFSLNEMGVVLRSDQIRIDDQGIIQYKGYAVKKQGTDNKLAGNTISEQIKSLINPDSAVREEAGKCVSPITGYIGQIIAPDENGVIVTKFKAGNNSAIVTGYDTYFEKDDPLNHRSPIERMRAVSYEKKLLDTIAMQLKTDYASSNLNIKDGRVIGKAFSLNSIPRQVTHSGLAGGENYEQEFLKNEGSDKNSFKTKEDLLNKIEMLSAKARMTGDYVKSSTITDFVECKNNAAENGRFNDNYDTAFNRMGRTMGNMIPESYKGYFDSHITGNTTNTGMVLYLTKDAKVNPNTGTIEPARKADGSIETEASTLAWEKDDTFKYSDFDSSERIAMAKTNHEKELGNVKHVGFAQISLGGWNMDDGVVISSDFANSIRVPDERNPGQTRPLAVGDKLSDSHGNKGVISLIVDRNMSVEEAKEKGLEKVVKIFADNKNLHYVTSPYSAVSRMNGGTYVEANDSDTEPLMVDGKKYDDSLGYIMVHVLEQTVDHKTTVEDSERQFGSQVQWAMVERGATEVLKEIFQDYKHDSAYAKLQEYLNVLGGSINADGTINSASFILDGVDKNEFTIPDKSGWTQYSEEQINALAIKQASFNRNIYGIDVLEKEFNRLTTNFRRSAQTSGGYMKIPFPVKMANGINTPLANDKSGYLLPLMSPKLRSEMVLYDTGNESATKFNDFTEEYMAIYKSAVRYTFAKDLANKLSAGNLNERTMINIPINDGIINFILNVPGVKTHYNLNDEQTRKNLLSKLNSELEKIAIDGQTSYERIVSKLTTNKGPLDTKFKHNFVKDQVVGKTIDAATMVISEDPLLDVGYISMSKKNAIELGILDEQGNRKTFVNEFTGVRENVGAVIYRDPVLRGGAARYVQVIIKDQYEGIGINPCAYKCQDGDFDGDTEVVFVPKTRTALSAASNKLSYESNLIDISQKAIREVQMTDDNGKVWDVQVKPLFMNSGLDLSAGEAADQKLKPEREKIENEISFMYQRQSKLLRTANAFYLKVGKDPNVPFDETIKNAGVPGKNYKEFLKIISEERKQAMNKYSEYTHKAYEASIGRHVISFGGTQKHADSILSTVVDGAKGSIGKLEKYLKKSLGLTVSVDKEKNQVLVEDVDKMFESERKSGFTTKDRNEALIATCSKTNFAGMVGDLSKRAYSSIGKKDVEAALEPAYAVQQRLMQAKHSATEAMDIIHNVTSVYPAFMDGKAIEKIDEHGKVIPLSECCQKDGTWVVKQKPVAVYSFVSADNRSLYKNEEQLLADYNKAKAESLKNGYASFKTFDQFLNEKYTYEPNKVDFVDCSLNKEEWNAIAKAYYRDADGLNNPDIDPDLLNRMAKAMQPEGTDHVIGVSALRNYEFESGLNHKNSFLLNIVYGKTSVVDMLKKHVEYGQDKRLVLFGDKNLAYFMAPKVILQNIANCNIHAFEKIKQIVMKDTVEGRNIARKSDLSITAEQYGGLVRKNTGMSM